MTDFIKHIIVKISAVFAKAILCDTEEHVSVTFVIKSNEEKITMMVDIG